MQRAKGGQLKKYRRIEVNAYRRRVTVVSGEWRPSDLFGSQVTQPEDDVSINDRDGCEPVEPDSSEGQQILVEAIRTLEHRLSPQSRALIGSEPKGAPTGPEEFNPET